MKKKLTPASIVSQKKWASFPIKKKNELRKMLSDTDGDGVPDKYDCCPENRRRQESFNENDIKYLKSSPKIKLKEKLGEGKYGEFYSIENNNVLGVKVPHCDIEDSDETQFANCKTCENRRNILSEGINCHRSGFNNKSMLTATRMVPIERNGHKCVGLVRPLVGVVNDDNAHLLTDDQLKTIRNKLIQLSKEGVALSDGIQCGFTGSGRVLQFDLGHAYRVESYTAFHVNNRQWISFLAIAKGLEYAAEEFSVDMDEAIEEARLAKEDTLYRELIQLKNLLKKYGEIRK